MPSFENVNYSLRPEKNIERKIILEILTKLQTHLSVKDYRYIGLGSMWFVDFRLMHEVLGITKMTSIEKYSSDRAEFNRPYACIEVIDGDTKTVLPELNLRTEPAIVWLDHDTDLRGPGLDDLMFVSERLPRDSIVLLTLNAHHRQVDGSSPQEQAATLRNLVGNLMPDVDTDSFNRLRFQETVSKIIQAAIRHALARSGRSEIFLPLFNYAYRDNAPMITVGGLICSEDRMDEIDRSSEIRELPYLSRGEAPVDLRAPLLTLKEKVTLDRYLPCPGKSLSSQLNEEDIRFPLKQKDIEGYSRLYIYYPVYGETYSI